MFGLTFAHLSLRPNFPLSRSLSFPLSRKFGLRPDRKNDFTFWINFRSAESLVSAKDERKSEPKVKVTHCFIFILFTFYNCKPLVTLCVSWLNLWLWLWLDSDYAPENSRSKQRIHYSVYGRFRPLPPSCLLAQWESSRLLRFRFAVQTHCQVKICF